MCALGLLPFFYVGLLLYLPSQPHFHYIPFGAILFIMHSEHLMRRIVCEADAKQHPLASDILSIYNQGMDTPYVTGSVEKLGYGVDKYVLLRVGPFPGVYESLSLQHLAKGDQSSALIAAEACNGKFAGFGLPISMAGMTLVDFRDLAILAGHADTNDSTLVAMGKLQQTYEKIRKSEQDSMNGIGSDT
jgi:hypothetical protein